MRCPIETRDTADQLLAYCARKLDPESTAVLERHMETCAACREFAEGQRLVWEALDEWEVMPVSADFNRRLYRRIDEQVSWFDRFMRPVRPMLVRQGLPIAAAACLVIMAGVLLERPAEKPAVDPAAVQVDSVQPDQVEHALEDMELLRDFHLTVRADASQTRM